MSLFSVYGRRIKGRGNDAPIAKPEPKTIPKPIYPLWKYMAPAALQTVAGNPEAFNTGWTQMGNWLGEHREAKTFSKYLDKKGHTKLAKVARFLGFGKKKKSNQEAGRYDNAQSIET